MLGSTACASLRRDGYCVIDGVLNDATIRSARSDITDLRDQGALAFTDQHSAAVRSDRVTWVSEDTSSESGGGLRTAMRRLRAVASQLEDEGEWPCCLGVPSQAQLAVYDASASAPSESAAAAQSAELTGQAAAERTARIKSCILEHQAENQSCLLASDADADGSAELEATGGARYTAHRDGFRWRQYSAQAAMLPGISMREITAIIYLSDPEDWTRADLPVRVLGRDGDAGTHSVRTARDARDASGSGSLLLHLGADESDVEGDTAHSWVEIAPVGGRLVLFNSREVLHEVRPHTRTGIDRVALTVWLGGAHDVKGFMRHCGRMVGCGDGSCRP